MVIINEVPEQTKTGTICELADVKAQLNIESTCTDDDTLINDLISVAIEEVEDYTKSDILQVANVLTYELKNNEAVQSYYRINRAPIRSFTKLEVQINEAWEEVASDQYKAYTKNFNWLEVELTGSWPAGTITALRFTFESGYTDAKRPKKIKHATILKAVDLYDVERSNYVVGTISNNLATFERLLLKHVRKYWV